jgi:membrane associated rhomboid family serine protease
MVNLPAVVVVLVAAIVLVHGARALVLGPRDSALVVLTFGFIPLRETLAEASQALPGGAGARAWSVFTYALLHADWAHVGVNALWLAAFGSPLARRLGPARFLVFSAAGAAAGALLHLAVYPRSPVPLVGASAAISAYMAGAARFVFAPNGPLLGFRGALSYGRPAAPLAEVVRDRQVLVFLAVWFGINLVFGLSGSVSGLTSGAIAWEAHIGGFVAGLLLFPLFDPVPRRPA